MKLGLALPRKDWYLIFAGAVLYALAFPPFHLFLPSFLCLVPAVFLVVGIARQERPLRALFARGFWFGFLAHGLVLYWIVIALWHYTWLSGLGYLTSIAVLGAFTGGVFVLTGWVWMRTGITVLVTFPVFWVAARWTVAHLPDVPFPWLGLGTSLTGFPTLVQIADVVGARGVTLLLVMANAALATAWLERTRPRAAAVRVGGVAFGVLLAAAYGILRERTVEVRTLGRVSVLQPNVIEKREGTSRDSAYQAAYKESAEALLEDGSRLVVWPEVAVPTTFRHRPDWKLQIAAQAHFNETPLLVGALDMITEGGRITDYFNAAFLFDSTGDSDSYPPYRKRYLVPVTERVPFVNPDWLGRLEYFGGATPGREGPVYTVGIGRFGVLICYESIFEDLSRRYRRDGADFLVNITNDAWFGRTSAPYQHAAHLVMRAIENRVGIARAANTGISEFVDPLGRERQQTALYTRTRVVSEIETTDVTTLYVLLGDWMGLLAVLGALALTGYAWLRRSVV